MYVDPSLEGIAHDVVVAFNEPIDVLGVAGEEEPMMDDDEGENDGEIAGPSKLPSPPPLTFDSDTEDEDGDDDDAANRLDLAFDRAVHSQTTPPDGICKYNFTTPYPFYLYNTSLLLGIIYWCENVWVLTSRCIIIFLYFQVRWSTREPRITEKGRSR